jgi:hypothetical protein
MSGGALSRVLPFLIGGRRRTGDDEGPKHSESFALAPYVAEFFQCGVAPTRRLVVVSAVPPGRDT